MKHSAKTRFTTALLCLLLLLVPLAQAAYYTPLKKGDSGASVQIMQTTLNSLSYPLRADGKFGQSTVNAVRAFQRVNGLKVDGVAGTKTLTLLYSGRAKGNTPPQPPKDNTPGTGTYALVATQRGRILYLRSSRSSASRANVIAMMPQGAKVEVLEKGGSWSKVRYGGKAGYAMTGFLAFEGTQPAAPSDVKPGDKTKAIVATQPGRVLNLRSSRSNASNRNIIGTIRSNTVVRLLEKGATWSKVSHGGKTGYVMSGFLRFP